MTGGSAWTGRSLAELDLRARHGVNVLGIQRGDERLVAPEPGEVLRVGDRPVVAGAAPAVEGLCAGGEACQILEEGP
ncbi:MAG: TrkA C-terminal domain-containing protein [Proteobacteria bacterium]|nr:TrkA C-terminal domain-containing protein [Pseudomonadota bacterium]